MKTPFIWLGSKRAEKRGVGPIGSRLDYAAKMGLPVANGAILLHEFYQLLLDEKLIHWQNGRFHVDDPQEIHDALYTAVRFPKINKPVTVRPVFNIQINQPTNYECIKFTNASQLTDTLCTVWQVAGAPSTNIRRDIIIQETITPEYLGIAISKSTEQIDQTIYAQPDETKIISPTDADRSLQMSRLKRWESANNNLPTFAQRLQKLLRGVRRTFGDESWQIEWADNGRICWLTKIEIAQ
ncbi:MAG: hypothetical protein DWQ04_24520 [Chloroflexi bacterium]|nr:MAG: hypothetical protein DWQ04_24520 [Chloroflexota bacterium]